MYGIRPVKYLSRKLIREISKKKMHKVLTLGVYDGLELHEGHIWYLKEAKKQGKCLIVGVNNDESVRSLKLGRPILPFRFRQDRIASIPEVDFVYEFDGDNLSLAKMLKPDTIVTSTTSHNYHDPINQQYRDYVRSYGGRIIVLGKSPSVSTTDNLTYFFQGNYKYSELNYDKDEIFNFYYNSLFTKMPSPLVYIFLANIINQEGLRKIIDIQTSAGLFPATLVLYIKNKPLNLTITSSSSFGIQQALYNISRAVIYRNSKKTYFRFMHSPDLSKFFDYPRDRFDLVNINYDFTNFVNDKSLEKITHQLTNFLTPRGFAVINFNINDSKEKWIKYLIKLYNPKIPYCVIGPQNSKLLILGRKKLELDI